MSKIKSSSFYLVVGPFFLLATLFLLFYKTAFLVGKPVWMCGIALSILSSSWMCFLAFKEYLFLEENLEKEKIEKSKEAEDMRSVLDETHLLYREKIEQLEKDLTELEEKEKDFQQGYEKLHEELKEHKMKAFSLKNSLEDALEELRQERQIHYLLEEKTPKDLIQKHKQLRDQFEEKSIILDQTRRRLFTMEGQLVALKKEKETKELDEDWEHAEFFTLLQNLQKENTHLEKEIRTLEQILSTTLIKKKKTTKPKKKEEVPEFQLEV